MATFVAKNSGGVDLTRELRACELYIRCGERHSSLARSVDCLAADRHARIHTEISEQPSFFIKL